jgi:2-polyprenyl-3-methyl-5-hydroxy-6-metoxy-1,4-benzoquinol methylase
MVRWLINGLDNPIAWRASRWLLNAAFGLYRKRFHLLRRWGALDGAPSVLDIGCGIGQYARISRGPYLGVDLNERYVRCAAHKYRHTDRAFRCADVTRLWQEERTYNLVLMVDFLHHIPDEAAVRILRAAAQLSDRHVVSFEPVREQANWLGQWVIAHDRGDFIRPLADLQRLFERAGLPVSESRELELGPLRTRAILCRKARSVALAA